MGNWEDPGNGNWGYHENDGNHVHARHIYEHNQHNNHYHKEDNNLGNGY
jgi:hypothetical protein